MPCCRIFQTSTDYVKSTIAPERNRPTDAVRLSILQILSAVAHKATHTGGKLILPLRIHGQHNLGRPVGTALAAQFL
jgi:hypothetical protein